jgi:hypothetical protein
MRLALHALGFFQVLVVVLTLSLAGCGNGAREAPDLSSEAQRESTPVQVSPSPEIRSYGPDTRRPSPAPLAPLPSHTDVHTPKSQLLDQVRDFAIYDVEPSAAGWAHLTGQRYGSAARRHLLASLRRLRDAAKTSPEDRCYVAFALCSFNVDYKANRRIIVSGFRSFSNYADDLEGMISRLIDKGDRSLMFVLFPMSPRSDGCLAEGLGATFGAHMQKEPVSFLLQLKTQPRAVRESVYGLMPLGISDENRVKGYLARVPRNSPLARIAREMRVAIWLK